MKTSILEQIKAQSQVLLPIVKELKTELGEERAYAIITKALRNWAFKIGQDISKKISGSPTEKLAFLAPSYAADNALDIEVIKQTSNSYEYKVTRCRYAEFYQKLGEPELGFLFVCAQDFPIAEGISLDLKLNRTKTIMQGADSCDFRYEIKN